MGQLPLSLGGTQQQNGSTMPTKASLGPVPQQHLGPGAGCRLTELEPACQQSLGNWKAQRLFRATRDLGGEVTRVSSEPYGQSG